VADQAVPTGQTLGMRRLFRSNMMSVPVVLWLVLAGCTSSQNPSGSSSHPAVTSPSPVDENEPFATATPPFGQSSAPFVSNSPGPTPIGPPVEGRACGVERWAVKTGTDPEAKSVNVADVHDTTIAALDALPRPSDPTTRVPPVETTVYRVHATLTYLKLESDSDIHLVLSDGAGHSMIAEIPSPACDAGSASGTQIAQARSEFDARHREETSFVADDEQVTVTGVGFFDFKHGQRGVAPNAVELHPVFSIMFG
jgi:hypothetical protein